MTDLLTRDPNDTGEIPPVDQGPATQNLAPYQMSGPALRLYVTGEVPVLDLGDSRATLDGELVPTGGIPGPDPTPPFPPPPPPPTPGYVGRHRAPDDMPAAVPPGRFGALRSVLASAWMRVRGAM